MILSAENYSNTSQWESIGSRFDLTVDAKSTATITSLVGAATGAVGVGLGAAAGSVGVSLARNLIGYDGITDDTGLGNIVDAYIKNAVIEAAGDVAVRAYSKDTLETTSFAGSVAVAVAVTVGVAVRVAVAVGVAVRVAVGRSPTQLITVKPTTSAIVRLSLRPPRLPASVPC